jgi:hypothetical protein
MLALKCGLATGLDRIENISRPSKYQRNAGCKRHRVDCCRNSQFCYLSECEAALVGAFRHTLEWRFI